MISVYHAMKLRSLLAVVLALILVGCKDDPIVAPDGSSTNVAKYFAPSTTLNKYLWKHTVVGSSNEDTLGYFRFIAQSSNSTIDGFSPIAMYQYSDTSETNLRALEMYLSPTAVIYYGRSSAVVNTRIVLLSDTLQKGKQWVASDSFNTPSGGRVKIVADISDFFPSIVVGDSSYSDVFRVRYVSEPMGGALPKEEEYRLGGWIVRYFAKNVGMVLEFAFSADSALLRKNELLRTLPY